MSKHTRTINDDVSALVEDARALVTATAGVAESKVTEARERLAAALENGKEIYGRARDKAIRSAQAADEAVQEHPYHAIGVALVVGVVAGFLIARR